MLDMEQAGQVGIKRSDATCELCYVDGGVSRAQFKCGHFAHPECAFEYFKRSVALQGCCVVKCLNSTVCSAEIDVDEWYVAAALTKAEQKEFDEMLGKNVINDGSLGIAVCPNTDCQLYFVVDGSVTDIRLACTVASIPLVGSASKYGRKMRQQCVEVLALLENCDHSAHELISAILSCNVMTAIQLANAIRQASYSITSCKPDFFRWS